MVFSKKPKPVSIMYGSILYWEVKVDKLKPPWPDVVPVLNLDVGSYK